MSSYESIVVACRELKLQVVAPTIYHSGIAGEDNASGPEAPRILGLPAPRTGDD